METIKDVLCFLNELDFADEVENDDLEKLREVKSKLVTEFEDYNVSKLAKTLRYVDELFVSHATNDLYSSLMTTNESRETIFYLFSFEHFVNANGKHENEQLFD